MHLYPLDDSVIGAKAGTLEAHNGRVTAIAYSPDGLHIASADSTSSVSMARFYVLFSVLTILSPFVDQSVE